MGFLSTNTSGTGTLYDFSSSDLYVYLLEGVRYLRHGGSGPTVRMDVAASTFIVGGSINANGVGVEVTGAGAHTVEVTADGRISTTALEAVRITTSASLTLMNAGIIQTSGFPAVRALSGFGTQATIVNSGLIQVVDGLAITLFEGSDRLTNSGHIVGSVSMGDNFDMVTNSGLITGSVNLGAGSDIFINTGGVVTGEVSGGSGDDTYYINGDEMLIEGVDGGRDTVFSRGDYVLPINFEVLLLQGSARVGHGNGQDNEIYGTGGDDRLYGGAGDDTLVGGAGDNRLSGGRGDDDISGGDGADEIWGDAGNDTVSAGHGRNTVHGGSGDDAINGGDDEDQIWGDVGDDVLIMGHGVNLGYGGSGDDAVYGGRDEDTLYGGGGNDYLVPDLGENRAFGEAGNDEFLITSVEADHLDGGAGNDLLNFAVMDEAVTVNLLTGVGGAGAAGDTYVSIEYVRGSFYSDVITGSNVDNVLFGDAGADQLYGMNGNDVLQGGVGADLLDGGAQIDTADYGNAGSTALTINLTTGTGAGGDAQGDVLVSIENVTGGAGADTLTGNVYANVLRGGAGDDYLLGEQGNDTLEGGEGNDRLHGGPGADIFLFADVGGGGPGGWGVDQIQLFQDGLDRISFVGATAVNGMADLTITTQAGYVAITTASGDEIRLMGFTGTLDASDFIFN